MLIVVALVGLGSAARLLPRVHVDAATAVRRLAPGVAGAMAVTLFLACLGGRWHTVPLGSHGVQFSLGMERGSPGGGREALALTRAYPDGGGKANVVLTNTPYANFYATLFGSAMLRDYEWGSAWYVFLAPTGPPRTLADMDALVRRTPVPVRFFVDDPAASFLVVDPTHPHRPAAGPSVAAYGDPAALTDVEAAQYLARRYPQHVEVVHALP
jgi:hypothetical protein